MTLIFACIAIVLLSVANVECSQSANSSRINTWAVVLSSSRYFFNMRHSANALTLYHLLRRHGMDDDQIIILLSDSYACDPRKPNPATMYSAHSVSERINLYSCNVQVDYAGYDVSVRRFLSVLQGRYDENTPPSRRLKTDENSNIIIYAAGHSAEGFFKFQDSEFISSTDIAETLTMMWEQRRYRKVVFLIDTCRALSLCREITAPNVICLASSTADKDSYSHHLDPSSGLTDITRWTYESLMLLEGAKCRVESGEETTMQMSWHEFNYGEKRRNLPKPLSEPADFDAVNEPNAVRKWKLDEFFCAEEREAATVDIRYNLL
ncbi:putative Peptidase C13 family [Trypanosoma vivax]|uniref:Putative GPI-anchor transamidase subunit 8 (GPI8) n=1 Tax=Trypanosoma vivax (strain Y486) TaxID=1055687 RepID=G0U4D4_TRYVY|nr:putative GPI-anchor transamidase subunit 8 (GPI8) [Trypanosoma vivax]KAH8611467.1 putative Peptidase C13 family [Trypanosoma vivax]CCC52298.1 putative GPI-anchor transamidase subunit 8 (GPI8) [Trypanosoma vivax Y486]